jgi:pilus assembly protein CpaE
MGQDIRFIVLTGDEAFGAEVRSMLLKQDGVKILAEVEEPALLPQAVQQFPVDALLVNLDPTPDTILPILGDIANANRDLAIFTASQSTDGQLILKAMRTGVREFFPKPIDAEVLGEAIRKITVDRVEATPQGSLITVVGTSGGVGATLIATNLAVELTSLAEGKVTVVDLDYRYGQVATLMDVDPKYSLADLCSSPEMLEPQVIGRALMNHSTGVQVLGRPNHLTEADTITAAACVGVCSNLLALSEYVVADGPTRFDVGSKSVLALSDFTLLIIQQSVPCVRNALRIIESMRENGYNLDRAKLVCNRIGRGACHLSLNDVTETLGLKLFASLPDDWEAASSAINLGEPLVVHSPKSKLRIAIREIAERLHKPDSETDDRDARKQSLIGRIFAAD